MLPVLPSRPTPELDELAFEVLASSAALGKGLHPLILEEVARLMSKVNSYYTNSMEGNPSTLKDIDAALRRDFSEDRVARDQQLEHVAHIRVQEEMSRRLREEPGLRVCSEEFLRWLHERFFLGLPEALRVARTESGAVVPVEPGRLRERGVVVGRHEPPAALEDIRAHLARFEELLSPERLTGTAKLLGFAASHHRFLWVHPFPEGNGRVARLLTTAYGARVGVGDGALWTVARAFARGRREYDAQLALADLPRRNDLDGRGPLSEEGLIAFCGYFLRACAEQIRFMGGMLRLDELARRHRLRLAALARDRRLSRSGAEVMTRLLAQGEVPRGQVPGICGVKPRRASQVVKELLDAGLARSETPYGPLRLSISAETAAALFPELA